MATKLRFGIFILVVLLLCGAFLYGKEKNLIQKIDASPISTEKSVYENSFSYETTLTPSEIIKKTNAKIHSKQILENEGLEIYYCFVENINSFILSKGQKVNLQIAFNGEKSVIGFPIIQTGY